jgi:hypothetical protein
LNLHVLFSSQLNNERRIKKRMSQKKGHALLPLLTTAILVVALFPTLSFFSSFFIQSSHAQIATTTPPTTPTAPTQYTDEEHGFRVQLPANWIVDDAADYGEGSDEELSTVSLELLGVGGAPAGTLCPQEAGELQIGGETDCFIPEGSDLISVGVKQYMFDLEHMQQFASIIESGRNITTDDLLIFELERAVAPASLVGTQFANTDVQVISETDRTTNLVDAESGEIIASDVSVKEVQYTYRDYVAEANNLPDPDHIETILLVVHNNPEGNEETDDVRAFKLEVGKQDANVVTTPPGTMLQRPEVRQILDSFELVETS